MQAQVFNIAVILFISGATFAQRDTLTLPEHNIKKAKILYAGNFKKEIDKKQWIVEMESTSGSSVYVKNGKLVIDAKEGVTVWLNKLLQGNIQIEYKRTVLMSGGENDRLSDLNQFWMAEDPNNPNVFTRSGAFAEYDSLSLYYVGMGGNSNTTTRFRKYQGNGDKTLLKEYVDQGHLLKVGKTYFIKIIVSDGVTSFWVDGERYFEYHDPAPLREGYFGFRLVHSRQEVEDFKIYELH
jgi:rhamnogalacturonan endolyase